MKIQNIKIDWEKMFRYSLVLMLLAVILASIRTELQPWYLLWVLPLTPLLTRKKELLPASTIISLGLLLHYVPFLYTGNWNPPIPTIKNFINNISIAVALLLAVWYRKAKMIQ